MLLFPVDIHKEKFVLTFILLTLSISSSEISFEHEDASSKRNPVECAIAAGCTKRTDIVHNLEGNTTLNETELFSWLGLSTAQAATQSRHLLNVIIDKPVYIPLGTLQTSAANGSLLKATQYIFKRLDTRKSQFVLYPYPFTKLGVEFSEGSLISTGTPDDLPVSADAASFFQYVVDKSNIDLLRAQALYDISIGILDLYGDLGGTYRALTYEAQTFCNPLQGWIGAQKYANCWPSAEYRAYLSKVSKREPVSVVYLNHTDIATGFLFLKPDVLRFSILVIPDTYAGASQAIVDLLGADGTANLKRFVDAGGMLLTSGKGALVLESAGLVGTGTFDEEHYLQATNYTAATFASYETRDKPCAKFFLDDSLPRGYGVDSTACPEPTPDDVSYESWVARVLNFAVPLSSNGVRLDSLLSAPMVLDPSEFDVVSYWDGPRSQLLIKNVQSGFSSPTNGSFPHVMVKTRGKGRIVVSLGNSVFSAVSFPWFYNAVFLAMSRPMILDSLVGSSNATFQSIPAWEHIYLNVSLSLRNLFSEPLTNLSIVLYYASGLSISAMPDFCSYVPMPPGGRPMTSANSTYILDCTPESGTIAPYEDYNILLKVFIENPAMTQRGFGIPLVAPLVQYCVPSRNYKLETLNWGPVTVDADMAAIVRSNFDSEPPGFYPISGSGTKVDNILNAQNTEQTDALDVVYYAMLPLVTPLLDGNNQGAFVRTVDFDYRYYLQEVNNVMNYPYPFDKDNSPPDFDYLDLRRIGNRANILVADFSTPVKAEKIARDKDVFGTDVASFPDVSSIPNSQLQTNVKSDATVIKETLFQDSDRFTSAASQRLLAFLDLTIPAAFDAYNHTDSWPGGAVPQHMLNSNGTALRQNLVFVRTDVLFFNVAQYGLPQGVANSSHAITIDRYTPIANRSCNSKAHLLRQGFFSSANVGAGTYPPGLRPNEYSNSNLNRCNLTIIHADTLKANPDGPIKLTHYLVRVTSNPGLLSGDDAMFFKQDSESGDWFYAPGSQEDPRFGDYPEVRLKYIYGSELMLPANQTRRGGLLRINLPSQVGWVSNRDPLALGAITLAVDHISVVATRYDPESNSILVRFRRGLMPNENYGKDYAVQVNLEFLQRLPSGNDLQKPSFDADMTVDELFFDLSNYATELPFESFRPRPMLSSTLTFTRMLAMSLPAVRLEYRLKRGKNNNTAIQPWEFVEPLFRYGIFYQELKGRRSVYNREEFRSSADPGLVTLSGGYSTISHLGTSSIPFREYLTVGAGQMIPATTETSRVVWKDIWNRTWAQPVRSFFLDSPARPLPRRNFMMSTTFELVDPTTGERQLEWASDQPVLVRAQVKLYNNYDKTFVATSCAANSGVSPSPNGTSLSQFLTVSNNRSYGLCLQNPAVILENVTTTAAQRRQLKNYALCATTDNWYNGSCVEDGPLKLRRRPKDVPSNITWNYIQQVADYYPANYILPKMWDLTQPDYDDTALEKGYGYHEDNKLPSLDSRLTKPENVVAFPVFKGLGYMMSYANNVSHPKFPQYAGWWSDNLQNRDHTLLAGQRNSNPYAVAQPDLTQDVGWVPISQLTNIRPGRVATALNNTYTCNFNRVRIRVDPKGARAAFPENVFYNNVVPIDPSLDVSDLRLTNYSCDLSVGMYTPQNISQAPNYVATDDSTDWLYFAASLRGNAKETINIVYTLQPFDDVVFEGLAKVQGGPRFVYRNPCSGPNTYQMIDNGVNVVVAKRTDLTVVAELFPKTPQPSFDAQIYTLINLRDVNEANRQYKMNIYTAHYGFGDVTTSVYAGGGGGYNILQPGDTTLVKIELVNNAGFDWNMYWGAMDFDLKGNAPLDSTALLKSYKRLGIGKPLRYNFLQVEVPLALQPYITLAPSDYRINVAPQFYDFSSDNVACIRDGFKGTYWYDLSVSEDLPNSVRGRLYKFKVHLNETFFDALPAYNDPTGIHDTVPSIPSFYIGFKYPSGSPWAGKVFYTSGYATRVRVSHLVPSSYSMDGAKLVTLADIQSLRMIAVNQFDLFNNLASFFRSLPGNLTFTVTPDKTSANKVIRYDLSSIMPQFPIPQAPTSGPDLTDAYILTRTTIPELTPKTYTPAFTDCVVDYLDWAGRQKSSSLGFPLSVMAHGAYMSTEYYLQFVSPYSFLPIQDQQLALNSSATVAIVVRSQNGGDGIAYNVNMVVWLPIDLTLYTFYLDVKYLLDIVTSPDPSLPTGIAAAQRLQLFTSQLLPPGEVLSIALYASFNGSDSSSIRVAPARRRRLLSTSVTSASTVERSLVYGVDLHLQLDKKSTGSVVQQRTSGLFYPLSGDGASTYGLATTALLCSSVSCSLTCSHNISSTTSLLIIWRRRLVAPKYTSWTTLAVTSGGTAYQDSRSSVGTAVGQTIASWWPFDLTEKAWCDATAAVGTYPAYTWRLRCPPHENQTAVVGDFAIEYSCAVAELAIGADPTLDVQHNVLAEAAPVQWSGQFNVSRVFTGLDRSSSTNTVPRWGLLCALLFVASFIILG